MRSLNQSIEADSKDDQGQAPLYHAAKHGYETVIKLTERDNVETDSINFDSQTLLSLPTEGGHETVFRILKQWLRFVASEDSGESEHEAFFKSYAKTAKNSCLPRV